MSKLNKNGENVFIIEHDKIKKLNH